MPATREKSEKPRKAVAGVTIVRGGASAGGLEAFTSLLQGLPQNPGFAVVFVQHLAPQHESSLVPLLAAHTSLPVVVATQDVEVEINKVYVIPPNRQMEVSGSTLHLSARPADKSQYTPIDAFFSSLARSTGSRVIGVILSGTGSDGAQGLREIKGTGGLTIAQEPDSAKYDGMPRAAINTGAIDVVAPPN